MISINRKNFVVYYQGKEFYDRLSKMKVNIVYTSKNKTYLLFYCDGQQENSILKQIREIKGFKSVEPSLLYNEEFNFDVK